jgi:hemerythrin
MIDLSEWKPEYSVGNQTLDLQHKRLLELCKRLSAYECDMSKHSIDAFHVILNDLAFYASKHFETEEQVLRQIGYPKLPDQKKEHEQYGEKLIEFLFAAMNGQIDKTTLQDYLETWWINHILVSDMEYSNYLKQGN